MAVLGDVNDHGLPPAKQEVAHAGTRGDGDAQVTVVSHEDEHQEVTDNHLDDVQQRLQEVVWAQHPLPERVKDRQRHC